MNRKADNREYDEDELLDLAGLQHFCFCRRQWALIHIERQWRENLRTVEGNLLHERAHDDQLQEQRGDVTITRGMPVSSRSLGVSGICDVVEFRRSPEGVSIHGREGLYQPTPVEYKRGSPKENDADRLQLCCQAMCLEDMLCCTIPTGYLYYGETRRRTAVALDDALREKVLLMLEEMHQLYARRYTPRVRPTKSCNACSLSEICLPRLDRSGSARAYIDRRLREEER